MTTISLDIDGTISDYPQYWLAFLENATGKKFKYTIEAKLYLGNKYYEELKTVWRTGPEFEIPIYEEMKTLSEHIYSLGGKVYVNTRRPLHSFPKMKENTVQWLQKNKLKFEDVQVKSFDNFEKQKIELHIDDEESEVIKYANRIFPKSLILLSDLDIKIKEDLVQNCLVANRRNLNSIVSEVLKGENFTNVQSQNYQER
jgi:hypothetical protein